MVEFWSYTVAYADAYVPRWIIPRYVSLLKREQQENKVPTLWSETKVNYLLGPSVPNINNNATATDNHIHSTQATSTLSFVCGPWNTTRLGIMQVYGLTYEGTSVRCDVPFVPYFWWRFPDACTKEHCFDIWNALKRMELTLKNDRVPAGLRKLLGDCVLFVQFMKRRNGQRFDFGRWHPYLKIHCCTKQDLNLARQWLNEFDPNRILHLTSLKNVPSSVDTFSFPVSDIPILLFETSIKPEYLWNRHWYNPNAWLTPQKVGNSSYIYKVEEEMREVTTTCNIYLFVCHPSLFTWDKHRIDIPRICVQVMDIESNGLDALSKDIPFEILTMTSIFYEFGGGRDPVLKDIECLTHEASAPIDYANVILCKDEADMIDQYIERQRAHNTSIYITHNGLKFDVIVTKQRSEQLQCRHQAFGKDLKEYSRVRSKGEDGEYMGISHAGLCHIDTQVFFKLFFPSDPKSKKLQSIIEHFYANKENPKYCEVLDKFKHSTEHKDPLMRQFCQRLPPHILVNSKLDVHYKEIPIMFHSKDPARVKELLDYNIGDVFQTCRLGLTHNIPTNSIAFAIVFEISMNVYYSQGAEIKCMSRLWRILDELGFMWNVYQFPEDDPFLYSEPQEGATVQEAVEGFYLGGALLDVKSMYPSNIIEYGICKCALIEKRFLTNDEWQELQKNWIFREYCVQGRDLILVDGVKESELASHRDVTTFRTYFPDIEKDLMDLRNKYKKLASECQKKGDLMGSIMYTAMGNAVKTKMNSYYGLNGQQGTYIHSLKDMERSDMPELMRRLTTYKEVAKDLQQTKEAKQQACHQLYKEAHQLVSAMIVDKQKILKFEQHKQHVKYDTDPEYLTCIKRYEALLKREISVRREILNVRQGGGYWPFFPMGALITFLGRDYIAKTKQLILSHFQGSQTPYGDTDSLVVTPGLLTPRQFPDSYSFEVACYEYAVKIVEFINAYWAQNACKRGALALELEAIYRTLVLGDSKKYYFGQQLAFSKDPVTNKWIIELGDLKKSGLEMKKRDKAPYLRLIQSAIVKYVAQNRIPEAVMETRRLILELVHERVAIDDLAIIQVLNKRPEHMVHQTAASKVALQNESEGRSAAVTKQEILYVFVKTPNKLNAEQKTAELAMSLDKAKETETPINYAYYLEHHFKNPVCKLLKSVVKDIESQYRSWVLHGGHKTSASTISSFFGSTNNKRKAAPVLESSLQPPSDNNENKTMKMTL